MQRYRVNFGLLIGLFFGVIALGGGLYGLYLFQQSRNASTYLQQADEAEAAGELREARGYLTQYLRLRRDDVDALERWTRVRLAISKRDDAEPSERQDGYAALETFIQAQPTYDDLRKELVDVLVGGRRFKDALPHINYLLNNSPKDGDLQAMRMRCMIRAGQEQKAIDLGYKLIGYDKQSGEFDVAKATTPSNPRVYQLLASVIRSQRGDPEVADAIMDQLVDANPELSGAYLARGQYRAQYLPPADRSEAAGEDYEKALEADAENADALLAKAQLLMTAPAGPEGDKRDDYDAAYRLLQQAVAADTGDWKAYQFLARLEALRGTPEAAIAHYDAGIEATEGGAALQLGFYKAGVQLNRNDLEGAEQTIKTLEDESMRPEFVDYLKARLMYARDDWFKASQELLRLRPAPALSSNIETFTELNVTLGLAFERLGQYERALEAYGQVLQRSPNNRFCMAARDRMALKLKPQASVSLSQRGVNSRIGDELLKPKAEQDWDAVFEAIDEYASQDILPAGTADLLKAEVYVRRKMYKEAQARVKKVMKENPDDLRVWRAALRVIASDPEKGPADALKKLALLFDKFGDSPLLRLDRADFLMRLADENVNEQLMAVAEGAEELTTAGQVQLWKGLAARFQQLRDPDARQAALQRVAKLSPNELETLMELFQNAIESSDADKIAAAQGDILKVVGSKDDATYLYTEANRLLWMYASGGAELDKLDQADRLIERAMLERPDWNKLYQLQGLIALARGDKAGALASFEESASRGRADGRPLLMHVSLLLESNRYRDAARILEQIPEGVRQRLLGRRYAEILLNTGNVPDAIRSSDEVIELAGEDGPSQLWYGRFQLRIATARGVSEEIRAEARDKADKALARAVELSPDSLEVWLARVGLLIDLRRPLEAEAALRAARLALPEDQMPPLLARGFEWLGRWFDAENVFRKIYDDKQGDVAAARSLAAFYLGARYPRPDKQAKATPIINDILKLAAEDAKKAAAGDEGAGRLATDANVFWARRMAAEMLSKTRDYQKILDAEKLLSSNSVGGELSETDKLQMARILALRPEPSSRVKAIRLLEEVQRNRVLSLEDDLRLGGLYFSTGDWEACRGQMSETIARNPGVPAARERYINMLLQKGGSSNITAASRQLKKLQELAPSAPSTLSLVVRVAVRLGKQEQALAAISRLLPKDPRTAKANSLVALARLFTELGDLDRAETLFRVAAERDPNSVLFYADFLGTHREMGRAFEVLEKAIDTMNPKFVVRTGLVLLRANRKKVDDEFDGQIESWLTKALREDPESIPLQLQKAELADQQQRYDDAITLYRKLLSQQDLEGQGRAVVLNNLAYLLALKARNANAAEEAMGYVAEAIDLLGPQADILDTRAVVYTALEQYRAATTDLELALTENPTASKYFHKSRAHMLSGEMQKAIGAWEKAVDLGLTRQSIAVAEQDLFDELKRRIDQASLKAAG